MQQLQVQHTDPNRPSCVDKLEAEPVLFCARVNRRPVQILSDDTLVFSSLYGLISIVS